VTAAPPWWAALGPVQATVTCGADQHTVRWSDGALTAADHPDADGELVFGALGGDLPRCLELVRAWGEHDDDLEVLTLAPRSPADVLTVTAADADELRTSRGGRMSLLSYGGSSARAALTHRQLRYRFRPAVRRTAAFRAFSAANVLRRRRPAFAGSGAHPTRRLIQAGSRPMVATTDRRLIRYADLLALLALGTPFQLRLAATVAAAWSAPRLGRDQAAAGPALAAALTGRLAPAAAAWLDLEPDAVEASVADGDGWGELRLDRDGRRLTAALPAGWLASVWAAGLTVVDRRLVVAVTDATWPAAEVLAVDLPGRAPEPMRVRWTDDRWSVTD
jgi:hypothetical protein